MSTYFDLTSDKAKSAIPSSPVASASGAKRQKNAGGYTASGNVSGVNSDDSDDDPFEGLGVPILPSKHFTQPTQILNEGTPQLPSSPKHHTQKGEEVLVPASSPFRGLNSQDTLGTKRDYNGGAILNRIAPAGTSFKPPGGIQRASAPAKIIDIEDDDGPTYQVGSSGDDIEDSSADITPSVVKPGSKISMSGVAGPGFKNLMSAFAHPLSRPTQSKPAKALPVDDIQKLEDIEDITYRRKVERVAKICPPGTPIREIMDALKASRGYVEDATNMILNKNNTVDLTGDSPAVTKSMGIARGLAVPTPKFHKPPVQPMESQMRRTIKQPIASITERYGGTQKKVPLLPVRAESQTPAGSQTPPKPKRKLMQGRRNPAPDTPEKRVSPAPKQRIAVPLEKIEEIHGGVLSDGGDFDSEAGSGSEVDLELEDRVLKYLNNCELKDLVELVNVKESVVEFFLSKRPFRSLDTAREVSDAKESKTGRKSTKAPIGDKIVQNSQDMMSGYEAVDSLVAKCSELGKPLTEEMAYWGLNVFGAAKNGELEMTSFGEEVMHDSGIGTPASKGSDAGEEEIKTVGGKRKPKFITKPNIMADSLVLKDYQLVGLNWLTLLYKHGLSCILADDMGLGKTCQVIAFLSHIVENGKSGPHLVVVPPSTLENWLREFANFSPELVVEPYYGSQTERADIADRIMDNRDAVHVVVSTYDFTHKKEDNKFMRRLRPDVCVYDEGHVLKNPKSLKYTGLMKIGGKFRLLLTGTPLQNNLLELTSLLAFILPDIFREKQEDLDYIFRHKASTRDSDHAALLSAQRCARAKSMLTPFVLRRKKAQVLKHMPAKICTVEYCDMLPEQEKVYNGLRGRAIERAKLKASGAKVPADGENNPLMQLRKAAIHPMLFRRHFLDEKIEKMADLLRRHESEEFGQPRDKVVQEMKLLSDYQLHLWCRDFPCISKFDTPDLTWMNSGKVEALVRLVQRYKENGDRVLVFSQFVLVLDVLEAVFHTANVVYTRIDGSTKVNERQTLIDQFRDDKNITAFLLSTGAGGTGINLMYANKVIIFDGSFNPQDDIQAENRAHRVGQTRKVEVVRLVTKGTIEEQIYALGQSKLELDSRVAGEDEKEALATGEKMVAKMLLESEEKKEEEEVRKEGGDVKKEDARKEEGEKDVEMKDEKEEKTEKLPSRPKRGAGKTEE